MLELRVGRPLGLTGGLLHNRRVWTATAAFVDGDPRRDREHPRLQVPAVAQAGIAPQSPQERLLERILCALAPEQTDEVAENGGAVFFVEPFEWRNAHGFHHSLQRAGGGGCEMKTAVVGHLEVVEFARVEHVPHPGEIIHVRESWTELAGGGAVAAVRISELTDEAIFFTAFGDDALGHRAEEKLREAELRIECVYRDEPQRRGFTFLDDAGERTISVIGRKLAPRGDDPLPWSELDDTGGVYFTGGDPAALRQARRARVLVASARELPTLKEAAVKLDVLIQSGSDEGERYQPGDLDPAPRMVVTTEGRGGGQFVAGDHAGRWEAAPLPGPPVDAYGAGDSFAAALALALGEGRPADEAFALAARCAAYAMTVRGAFDGRFRLS
jgi:ribokinase